MKMDIRSITCGYGSHKVLEDVSFSLESGECLCLLGPNGVGKTTIFKTILGLLKPMDGSIYFDERNRSSFSVRELAQTVAYVPQAHTPPFPYTAEEVVALGRTAHLGLFSTPSAKDMEVAWDAMAQLGILHMKKAVYTQVSGGERQMIMVARALAQQPKFLILDEPTSNLDFGNQAQVLIEINRLRQKGMGIVMTTHNPDHAFMCSTKILLLLPNGKEKQGTCHDLITPENMMEAYGIDTCVGYLNNTNGIRVETCVPVINKYS